MELCQRYNDKFNIFSFDQVRGKILHGNQKAMCPICKKWSTIRDWNREIQAFLQKNLGDSRIPGLDERKVDICVYRNIINQAFTCPKCKYVGILPNGMKFSR